MAHSHPHDPGRGETASRPDLALTGAAEVAIRERLADLSGPDDHAFFVVIQPSKTGFTVGVGFEERGGNRPLRPRYAVPVQIADEDYERLRGITIDYQGGRFVTFSDVSVHVAETPNPDSRKFILNRSLVTGGGATFAAPAREDDPLLVQYLLEIPGVRSLFLIHSFCTVTRDPRADWSDLQVEIGRRLQAYLAHGGAPITPPPRDLSQHGEVERRIIEILEDVIRPAVQRDGGDIAFAGFENGVVQLYMLGSCVGCPSSMATLKMGVESLLKDSIPEVTEVVAIS